jgi:hypothetical protein
MEPSLANDLQLEAPLLIFFYKIVILLQNPEHLQERLRIQGQSLGVVTHVIEDLIEW